MNLWAHLQYSAEFISASLSFPTQAFPDITVSYCQVETDVFIVNACLLGKVSTRSKPVPQ